MFRPAQPVRGPFSPCAAPLTRARPVYPSVKPWSSIWSKTLSMPLVHGAVWLSAVQGSMRVALVALSAVRGGVCDDAHDAHAHAACSASLCYGCKGVASAPYARLLPHAAFATFENWDEVAEAAHAVAHAAACFLPLFRLAGSRFRGALERGASCGALHTLRTPFLSLLPNMAHTL